MKLNKLFIALSVASMAFASCENELVQDVELDIAIETNDNVQFDGKTITVKQGTPIPFKVGGDPDFLTFFSGEAGKKYAYRDRTVVDPNEIESSILSFGLEKKWGASTTSMFEVMLSDEFPGLYLNDFEADSIQVEEYYNNNKWQMIVTNNDMPELNKTKNYNIDLTNYLGKRITLAARYEGLANTAVQSRVTFLNLQIINKMTDGSETTLTASSLGLTPVNMLNKHNLSDQAKMTSNREYGTFNASDIAGIWNFKSMTSFYIQSTPAAGPLKYSWLVSSLFVPNGCTPDSGTAIKSLHQRLNAYNYTYNTPGTYTATFVATNGNYKQETSVVKEYTVVVTE